MQAGDRDSQVFWDAVSLGSDRNSIALSIYHSVPELQAYYEDSSINHQNNKNDKIWHDLAVQDESKSVDFILTYNSTDRLNQIKRQIFERNLVSEGLYLERDDTQEIHFIKIHVTREVLCRYAEILKYKFPIKMDENEHDDDLQHEFKLYRNVKSIFDGIYKYFRLDQRLFPQRNYELYHEFSRDKSYLFDVNHPNFFPRYVRFGIINFILERTAFADNSDDNQNCVGIDKLLADSAYISAYPLHDGHHLESGTQRNLLYNEWSTLKNWMKEQPLDTIKDYFGVKVALYFSWLGFYTRMLVPASIIGVICFLFGIATMSSDKVSDAICNANETVLLCPNCDNCDYTLLSDTCIYSRINHILDNNFTVFFSICMSIWASIYLELWKRYSANIVHRWGMSDFCRQSEHPRPAYLAKMKHKKEAKNKLNPITRQSEPTLSWNKKLPSYLLSYSIIILYIIISIAVVMALIVYRMSTLSSKGIFEGVDPVSYQYLILLPITTGIINLLVITILNYFYDYMAVFLTDLEYRRTQTEYDNSLSLKIYLFQFINYYSSLFYIAFLKGKFPGTPAKYNRFWNLRQEECSPGGCLMELFIQLAIIMIGKQAINTLIEIGMPFFMKKWAKFRQGSSTSQTHHDDESELKSHSQWTKDYKLMPWNSMGLFAEYLEMVLQFGFCTLFVIAFPLGPLFALINNIFELRLDARKFLLYYRRSVPKRISDIGIWFTVMSVLGKLSVITSAFIIAFSSNFIPRLVHDHSEDLKLMDYLEFTLAYFNVSDYGKHINGGVKPIESKYQEPEMCRYPEFRNPPGHEFEYKRPYYYWKILAARLAFIIIYQNVVAWFQQFIDWAIPDKPSKLDNLIKRESYLVSNRIIREEKLKILQHTNSKMDEVDYVNGGIYFEAKS